MQQNGQNPSRQAVSPDEVYAELDALMRSPVFNRSEKLQRFLRFVCEKTIRGGGQQINEYLIGSEVFRRGSDYNPSEDSIVRRHAHAMRQKLQEYYATEGADHAIRIEMPVGHYVPVFRRKEELPPEPAPGSAPALPVRAQSWRRRLRWGVFGVAIFALGWASAGLVRPAKPGLSAATREIWGAWIGADAVLSFSNPTSGLLRHVPEPAAAAPSNSMRVRREEEAVFREKFRIPAGGSMSITPTIVQTMMGEAVAATHVASLFARTGSPLRTTENRFLSWEDLRRENHVVFSGDLGNRWVDAVLAKYPFRVEAAGRARRIVNSAPSSGEEESYRVLGNDETRDEYALISMLPGVAPNRQLLLLCGVNSPAMPLATEYLTTEQGLQTLLGRLRTASPKHSGAWHFQAVIHADVRDKVVTKGSIVALRVL